jgi:oligoendopeptidase F
MTSRSKSSLGKTSALRKASALRKSTAQRKSTVTKSKAKSGAGKLPEWNLADLYSGIDAPEVTRDLQKMDSECVAFETDYKGKLAERVAQEDGGKWLATAVQRY